MRFLTIFAAAVALVSPALAQDETKGQNCLDQCHVYSREANCPKDHSAVYREGPGCFKCCEAITMVA